MNFWLTKLLLALVLALFSLQVPVVRTDAIVSFDQIYTNSAAFSISGLSSIQLSKNCSVTDSSTGQEIHCENGNACKCTAGVIVGLQPNTVYNLNFKEKNEQAVLSSATLHTASNGVLQWEKGISSISYTIEYLDEGFIPSSCVATLESVNTQSPILITGVLQNPCLSGKFTNLETRQEYHLDIKSNSTITQSFIVNTGYFDLTITKLGVMRIEFVSQSDMETSYFDQCEIFEENIGSPANCINGPCNCLNDVLSGLTPNTEYKFRFTKDVDTIYILDIKTAETGTISVEAGFQSLSYSIAYPKGSENPSGCQPCTFTSGAGITVDDCIDTYRDIVMDEALCHSFIYYNLEQEKKYDTILLDSNFDVVATISEVRVPVSTLTQTSIQLTSAGYRLETELSYDRNQYCSFFDPYNDLYTCELENGVRTTECPCQSGKLVDLDMDAYIFIDIIQKGKTLISDAKVYTAYSGDLVYDNVGLFSLHYSVTYFSGVYPPQNCITCVIPKVDKTKNCDAYSPVNSTEICLGHKFNNLINGTEYNLLVYDGDLQIHHDYELFTSNYPIKSTFEQVNDAINYTLVYAHYEDIPFQCRVYFQEDPLYPVECDSYICDCQQGLVYRPADNKKLSTIVITDNLGEILAVMPNKTGGLSVGAIVGIAIGVIVLAAVVIGLGVYFGIKK